VSDYEEATRLEPPMSEEEAEHWANFYAEIEVLKRRQAILRLKPFVLTVDYVRPNEGICTEELYYSSDYEANAIFTSYCHRRDVAFVQLAALKDGGIAILGECRPRDPIW